MSTAAGGEDVDGIDIGANMEADTLDFALIVSEEGTVMVVGSFSGGRPMKFAVDSDDLRLIL